MSDQVKSVNEYIGDSGKELEGAAEQIVESYMGEYMQVVLLFKPHMFSENQEYMKGWYQDYCAKTGQFCDQVKSKDKIFDQSQASGTNFEHAFSGGDGPWDKRP